MATKAEILENLSQEQVDAVINYSGKIALEALPGAGKTATMVSRCQYMIKDGVPPSKILVFTFTKKAAEELYNRIYSAVGPDADKMTIGTYHSFCGRLLRIFPEYAARNRNFSIYDEDDKKSVLDKIVKGFTQAPSYSVVSKIIGEFKLQNLSPDDALIQKNDTSINRVCARIYQIYENEMRKRNAFDFDDLPFWAYRITKMNNEVSEYISKKYDYILSDENQDANKQNLDFILMLGAKNQNILVVGDTDQSIYGFRGADIENVINTYKKNNFNIKFLSTNYRSTETIVRAADCVISNNKNRITKESNTINEIGDKIKIVKCNDQNIEADYIVKKIKELVKDDETLQYGDIAILSRLQAQTRIFEEKFLKEKIPYKLKGIIPFFSRAEIKDILAYIKLVYNPNDLSAFLRIINVPKRGIGKASLDKVLLSTTLFDDIMNNEEHIKVMKSIPRKARQGFDDFFKVIKKLKSMIDDKKQVFEILTYIRNVINYDNYLYDQYAQVPGVYNDKIANLNELISLSYSFDNNLEDFLNNAYLGNDSVNVDKDGSSTGPDNNNFVNVMTIHGAKGLEYKIVFICGANDNLIPFFRSHDSDSAVEEERRLFYVAMTRAKKLLYITHTSKVMDVRGSETRSIVSRFVNEIPDNYSEKLSYNPPPSYKRVVS